MKDAEKCARSRIAAHLDTEVSYRLGVPLIYVRGELDHDSAAYLREVVAKELSAHPRALILEFSDLSYMANGTQLPDDAALLLLSRRETTAA